VKIRVLIVHDQALLRECLSALIDPEPDMEVVGKAASGGEAVGLAGRLRPDVVVVEAAMPDLGGCELVRGIVAAWPAAKIVALTLREEPLSRELLSAGAAALVDAQASVEDLLGAIRAVAAGP